MKLSTLHFIFLLDGIVLLSTAWGCRNPMEVVPEPSINAIEPCKHASGAHCINFTFMGNSYHWTSQNPYDGCHLFTRPFPKSEGTLFTDIYEDKEQLACYLKEKTLYFEVDVREGFSQHKTYEVTNFVMEFPDVGYKDGGDRIFRAHISKTAKNGEDFEVAGNLEGILCKLIKGDISEQCEAFSGEFIMGLNPRATYEFKKHAPVFVHYLPEYPSIEDIRLAMHNIEDDVLSCMEGKVNVAVATMLFEGSSGTVTDVKIISADINGTDTEDCVEYFLHGISIPRFRRPTFSVTYPFNIDRIVVEEP